MKPEILLKAYVLYQSEDAFRELVASSLDEVYSTALQIVQGPPHLAEETVLRVYWELARKASRLGADVAIGSWLHEHACKMAVNVLHENDRSVDRPALKKAKQALPNPNVQAPPGLATRVCQGVLLNAAEHKGFRLCLPQVLWPAWIRPVNIGAAVVCVFVIVLLWNIPFHRHNPVIQTESVQLTPASFAQLASPEEGEVAAKLSHVANTNAETNPNQQ